MITRIPRTLSIAVLAALLSVLAVSPTAHAATVTTWAQLRDALAAGGHVTVGADITGEGVVTSTSHPTTLDLAGRNVNLIVTTSNYGTSGGVALVIEGGAHLTVQDSVGGGRLVAESTSGPDAVIGTRSNFPNGTYTPGALTVDGAAVEARQTVPANADLIRQSATVGGGHGVDGLDVTVNSGSLSAVNHSSEGAAIGGGIDGDGGTFTVRGGDVTAISHSRTGAVIGGGADGDGGTIDISGGTVSAQVFMPQASSTALAAVIGGGFKGSGANMTVSGGAVTVEATGQAAGIGGGARGSSVIPNGGTLHVSGGTVTVNHEPGSQNTGTGIGAGFRGSGTDVTITGGVLDVQGAAQGTSIGAGPPVSSESDYEHPGTVKIAGSLIAGTPTSAVGAAPAGFTTVQPAGSNWALITNDTNDQPRTRIEMGYFVTLDAAGGTGSPDQFFVVGGAVAPAPVAPTRVGNTFTGWKLNGAPYTFTTPVTGPLTLTAGWQPHIYGVTFNSAGGSDVAFQAVAHGSTVLAPSTPTREGYTFTGWKLNNAPYTFATPVTGPLTLTAGWELTKYRVTFNSAGGSNVASQSVEHGSTASAPAVPTRAGHDFTGWYVGDTEYNFDAAVTSPLVLTAHWEHDPSYVPEPEPKPDPKPDPKPVTGVNLIDVSGNKNSTYFTQFYKEIQWLANSGITRGWHVGGDKYEFRPKQEITREAMAAFMYRYAGSPKVTLPAKSPFKDVSPQSTNFYKEIVWMNQQGISTGWAVGGNKEFRPKDNITRDAMAAFMYRFAGKPKTTPPATSPFADVAKSSQFYKEITWLANAGISTGWTQPKGKPQYRPYAQISREAMAAFLYRLDRL